MKVLPHLAACLLFLTSPALAADKPLLPQPEKKPAQAPYDWTGAYVGGSIGFSRTDTKWSGDTPSDSTKPSGTLPAFGAQAGYNYQFSNGIVFGSETSVSRRP